jgi:hypothetical protein
MESADAGGPPFRMLLRGAFGRSKDALSSRQSALVRHLLSVKRSDAVPYPNRGVLSAINAQKLTETSNAIGTCRLRALTPP